MSVTHSTAARDAATNAVTLTLGASARLKLRQAGTIGAPGTQVANLAMTNNANGGFGASASGTATAAAITSDTNTAAGTVATATLETSGGTVQVHCAVAASASDINLTNGLTFQAGDTAACSSLTYTALPA